MLKCQLSDIRRNQQGVHSRYQLIMESTCKAWNRKPCLNQKYWESTINTSSHSGTSKELHYPNSRGFRPSTWTLRVGSPPTIIQCTCYDSSADEQSPGDSEQRIKWRAQPKSPHLKEQPECPRKTWHWCLFSCGFLRWNPDAGHPAHNQGIHWVSTQDDGCLHNDQPDMTSRLHARLLPAPMLSAQEPGVNSQPSTECRSTQASSAWIMAGCMGALGEKPERWSTSLNGDLIWLAETWVTWHAKVQRKLCGMHAPTIRSMNNTIWMVTWLPKFYTSI